MGALDRRATAVRAHRQPDGGLWGTGIALILAGWLGAGATTTAFYFGQSSFDRERRPSVPGWAWGWVPVLHPLAALGGNGSSPLIAAVVGVLGGLMEIGGLVLAVLGAIGREVPDSRRDPVALRLGAPGAEGGLSLDVRL